ncbi:hypothetical protein Hdeb2414_s0018g00539011 [Helianthus debilis subsp. tardiflorus]
MEASRRGGWGRFIIPSDFTPTSSLPAVMVSPLIYLPNSCTLIYGSSAFLLSQAQRFSLMRLRI